MEILETRLRNMVTLPTNNKISKNFYVRYLGMPENIGNLLGRQTTSFTPPPLEVDVAVHQARRNPIQDTGRLSKTPITLSIKCDDVGYVEMILVNQFKVQRKQTVSSNNKTRPLTFDIRVDYFTGSGEIAYYVVYRKCIITNLTLPTSTMINDDTPLSCDLNLSFETTEYFSAIGDLLVDL